MSPYPRAWLAAFAAVLSLTRAAHAAPAPSSAGHWEGQMEAHGQALLVRYDLAAGPAGASGRFSVDRWRVMDYPLSQVALDGDRVVFHMGDNAFEGVRQGDQIRGAFKGDEGEGTFVLHRAPPPVLPYRVAPVSFRNGAVTLSGTLLLPATPGRHPAVVLLQGSGPEVRWGTNRYIADRFARAGIAVLIYDKRGAGQSGGDWRSAVYDDLARDALAGVKLLASRSEVDPRRIGLHGHSEGGMVAPLAASLAPDRVAFLVAEDTFVGEVRDQDLYAAKLDFDASRLSDADKRRAFEMYRKLIEALSGDRSYADLEAAIAPVKDEPWFKDIPLPARNDPVWTAYPRRAHFDTRVAWRKVRQPVLLVYGEHDQLVPIDDSIRGLEDILDAGGAPYAAMIAPRAEHNLTIKPRPGEPFFWWGQAPGIIDLVAAWVGRCTADGPCVLRSAAAARHNP